MKLLFSEARPDYQHYLFPYVIWALPDPGEEPDLFFQRGFLPSSKTLDRFYLCRQIRIDLQQFHLSSENKRILRKGTGIEYQFAPRSSFDYTAERRAFYQIYADQKFGRDVMTLERLDSLFAAPIISHLLVFRDAERDAEVGTVTLYLGKEMAYYYYSFYDLAYHQRNLGIFMMTTAVQFFAAQGLAWLYLGTCYSQNALYKTQFPGAEFFNGFRWSNNLKELKHVLARDQTDQSQHLLETPEFPEQFYGGLDRLAAQTEFRWR